MGPESASAIAAAVSRRERSAEEVTRAALDAIAARDGGVHAFLQTFEDMALRQARAIDTRVAAGESVGALAGVPVALKDNICLAWGRTTCASRMLEGYESPFNATAAARLMAAGAVVVGKTNLDEFAMGSSTERSAFGATANPWASGHVPGGSSGGSAAAVAAGMVPLALGSDTGGSIRQPAGLCGVVGLKPTYGRVSRYGLVAYASSLDQIGPLTRSVRDAVVALGVIAGVDANDATTSAREVPDFVGEIETPVEGLVLGVPREARATGVDSSVVRALDEAVKVFRGLGAKVVEVALPHAEHAIAAYYLVACAEASSNLARFDGVRYGRRADLGPGDELADLYARSRSEGFGEEVKRRIMLGVHALSSGYYDQYYATAMKARRLIKGDFDAAFGGAGGGDSPSPKCHAILMPTTPTPAFRAGERLGDPLAMYLEDVFTVGVNLAGLPAISVPAGMAEVDGARLPIGMQLVGAAFDEARLLRIARMFEGATGWDAMTPGG
ncbi:MAG: Asp-tRNA(Asn)/Glu-tRNA(Gln) amidotransferase subunit GatA [Phycisphaeraceae bacterium]|nr:Asp-tRNA(Asn)/Glu-tRNA(Gln) amidotransferase subunit GatA [Phycisphaeraceae bacterium]